MKIGIWNTAFLGDAILTLPLIHTIASGFPDAEIHFYTRGGVNTLFEAQPELTDCHAFDKRGQHRGMLGAYRFGRELSTQGFDLWISAHASFRSGLIARWSSIPKRIGYSAPWFNHFFYTHTVDRQFDEHEEIERLLRLAAPLALAPVTEPTLVLPGKAELEANDFFKDFKKDAVLGIHPGSTWATKKWPEDYFSRVLDKALDAGVRVIVYGGPGEEHVAARVISHAKHPDKRERVSNLAGKLSIPGLAASIKRLDCYLTGDSGPMHLAWVQKTPTVALFGPTVKKLGFFPRGKHATVLERELACRPCSLHGPQKCPERHHNCMRLIEPDEVFTAIMDKIGNAHG